MAQGGDTDSEVMEAQPKTAAASLDNLVTVSRTMAIFELLAGQTRGMTLSDIARRLDVNKSIALRILLSLEQANYLFRTLSSQRYLLTSR